MTEQPMPADTATLRRWVEGEHLTHQAIADRVFVMTGERVSPAAVSASLHRAGISTPMARYNDEMPWRVKVQHIKECPARMLRLLGRRRAGVEMSDVERVRLDAWLRKLEDDHVVVAYDPNSTFGFYYIDKDDETDGLDGIPIGRIAFSVMD